MASSNPFDLLVDDDTDDPSQLIAAQHQKLAKKKQPPPPPTAAGGAKPPAKLPHQAAPPAQAVKEARSNATPARGGGRGGGYGGEDSERERGSYGRSRQPYRVGGERRRGGYNNGDNEDSARPPRRLFERHSGMGRGNEVKREGSGRGNWGSQVDYAPYQVTEVDANAEDRFIDDRQAEKDIPASQAKESADGAIQQKEEQEEDKEMTLEEYEKILENKRKALLAMKASERKVDVDKELKSMQQLSLKKENDEFFIKLGSNKDSKKIKDIERDEKAKKSITINEFLKPDDGERHYSTGGRGRGRGRGDRGPYRGADGVQGSSYAQADIKIEDPGQFPTLGGK